MPNSKHFLEGVVHYPEGWKPDTHLGTEQIKWLNEKHGAIFNKNVATLLQRDAQGRVLQ